MMFSCSVMSNSLQTHGPEHTRLPCPSPSPRVYSNSCPLSQWCHPTISSSVAPFSSYPQSFPASGYFPVSWLFTSGDQSIGASASALVLPRNIQHWFPLGLTGLISLQSKELSRVFCSTTAQKHQFFSAQPSLWSKSYMTTGRTIALTIWAFVGKVMSLLFNMLSRFVIAFLPRSKHLLILAAVAICSDFGAQENKLSKLTLKQFYWDIPLFWPPDAKNWLTWKDLDAGKAWRKKGMTEDEMVGWHHWLNGYEFE